MLRLGEDAGDEDARRHQALGTRPLAFLRRTRSTTAARHSTLAVDELVQLALHTRLSWFPGSPWGHVPRHPKGGGYQAWRQDVIDLQYSIVIEATADRNFFAFHSPDLAGFTGVGHSVEDCLYRAKWGMQEHVDLLTSRGLSVPPVNPNPTVVIQNQQPVAARS
jgi:predicted RNase H-like HicB family nuclease